MNRIVLFFACFLIFGDVQSQEPVCDKLKNGVFKSIQEVEGKKIVTMITRTGNKQTEESETMGVKMEFDVKWTSACTYELSNPKVVKGSFPAASPDHVLVVKVLDVNNDSYKAGVSSNFFEGSVELEFLIVR